MNEQVDVRSLLLSPSSSTPAGADTVVTAPAIRTPNTPATTTTAATSAPTEGFYWGNGVLQCAAHDPDPAGAPLPRLSRAIRGAIAGFDEDAVAGFVGYLKKKVCLCVWWASSGASIDCRHIHTHY